VRLEALCVGVLREFITVLNDEIDFPYKINLPETYLLDSDQQQQQNNNNNNNSSHRESLLSSSLSEPLSTANGFPSAWRSTTAMKAALSAQTFRLFSFLLPSLLSGRFSFPGAVLGSLVSGASAAVSTSSAATTTAACLTGAVQGALVAPLGGLALLAGAIATKALVSVDYSQYTGAFYRLLGIGDDLNDANARVDTNTSDVTCAWTRDSLQRRALDSLLATVANPVVLANLRESIAQLIREEVMAHALSLATVDLTNSALCSSQRFFSLSTTFDQWRVLSVEVDAATVGTSEIGYCVGLFEGYERRFVTRRFSAFRKLYLALCSEFPEKLPLLSSFPPRTVFTCVEIGFLRSRCVALLAWLKVCESDAEIYQAPTVMEFFQLSSGAVGGEVVHVSGGEEWLLMDALAVSNTVNFSLEGDSLSCSHSFS
jgi:hypothetical protein